MWSGRHFIRNTLVPSRACADWSRALSRHVRILRSQRMHVWILRSQWIPTRLTRQHTSVRAACGKNNTDAVRLLLNASKRAVSVADTDGFTPLLRAGAPLVLSSRVFPSLVFPQMPIALPSSPRGYVGNGNLHMSHASQGYKETLLSSTSY